MRLSNNVGLRQPAAVQFTRVQRAIAARRVHLAVRAESGGGFFKKGESKEEAARRALQDAFKGTKDPFAAAEERRKKDGGGGGGGGSGGGGGGGGGFSFNFSDWGEGFRKWIRSTLRTIAAVILFASAISVVYLWAPLSQFAIRAVRWVLRLDGNPRAALAGHSHAATPDFKKQDGLGNVEEAVIGKYGGDVDEESEDEYDTDSGEE